MILPECEIEPDALAGEHGILCDLLQGAIRPTPLADVVSRRKPLDLGMFELAKVLAR